MTIPLKGAHILVTRPAHQADNLSQLIQAKGGIPVHFPCLAIVALEPPQLLSAKNPLVATFDLPELSKYQWLIFTSANAVNFALAANSGKITQFGGSIAAIGKVTAKALQSAALPVDLLPQDGYDSEALLATPPLQSVSGQNVLVVRGQGGREALAAGLMARGANVDYWQVYRRIKPDINTDDIRVLLEHNQLTAILISSYEALQNMLAMLQDVKQQKLTAIPLIVISNRIKQLAETLGFTHVAVSDDPSDEAIVATAIAIINGEKCG